jgi:hypothetical protein
MTINRSTFANFSLKCAEIQFSKQQKTFTNIKYDFFLLIFHLKYCVVPKSLYPNAYWHPADLINWLRSVFIIVHYYR